VDGGFYKLTLAPTFKAGDIGNFFSRPELRVFATYMNWDKDLDNYAATDSFGKSGFEAGGNGTLAYRWKPGSKAHNPVRRLSVLRSTPYSR